MISFLNKETKAKILGTYPLQFWVLIAGMVIDALGAALFSSLFSLFFKERFGIRNLDIGLIIVASVLVSLISSPIAGTASDRVGRKKVLVLSLFLSGLSIVGLAFADKLWQAVLLLLLDGLVSPLYGPAAETIISDVVPSGKYRDAYSILRVFKNLARMLGPGLGGLLAEKSFSVLLLTDGATSFVFLLLVLVFVQETLTRAQREAGKRTGYGKMLRHRAYITFAVLYSLAFVAQSQMTINVAIYLKAEGLPLHDYGVLMMWAGAVIAVCQVPLIKASKSLPANRLLAVGAMSGGIGVWLAGYLPANTLVLLIPVTIFAFGGIFIGPIGSAYAAAIAPEGMRGRYLSMMPILAGIGYAIGIPVIGHLMDISLCHTAWWIILMVGIVDAVGFWILLPPVTRDEVQHER